MSLAHSIPSTGKIGSYFDLVKPISIPNTTFLHHRQTLIDEDDQVGQEDLPEYLKSFHDSGISEARLKKFNWLHPRNYSGDGSLSDDHTLSPYGTSVSSPRGDAWEVVEPAVGPRKSIDELWDEVFEYQQRKRLLEEIQRVQDEAAAATAAQLHYTPNLDQIEEEEHQEYEGEGDDDGEDGGDKTKPSRLSRVVGLSSSINEPEHRIWSQYGGGSETCYSPLSYRSTATSASLADVLLATVVRKRVLVTLSQSTSSCRRRRRKTGGGGGGETPMTILSGTMTQISRTTVHASRKGVRSDRGSALRLLHSILGSTAFS